MIDGRGSIVEEVQRAPTDLQDYLRLKLSELLAEPGFIEALPGHLHPDTASQARLPVVLGRLRMLADPEKR